MTTIQELRRVRRLVRKFEDGTLPRRRWTHLAHLEVGLWYVVSYGLDAAIRRLRAGIREFNRRTGVRNTAITGYHETVTVFFAVALDAFQRRRPGHRDRRPLFERLAGDPIAHPGFLASFYSPQQVLSPEARRAWSPPDLRPLSDLDSTPRLLDAVHAA